MQKTATGMRNSDWSSDVCSSDLEESLQDVPVAVTAVSAESLERKQIDSIAQVGESVPNLTYQPGAPTGTGGSTPSIFIRGVGSSEERRVGKESGSTCRARWQP